MAGSVGMMVYSIPFDTLAFAKELEVAGVPPAQAEAHAKILSTTFQNVEASRLEDLATKRDLKELEIKVEATKAELQKEIEIAVSNAKVEIIRWVIAMSILSLGGMAALNRLMPPTPVYIQASGQDMRIVPALPQAPGR
ncbi:MAG: DUF1640 domain-containing protein [Magnetococcales bacterium]|nr:DUF1640 domain-containing protein [Magnetococcales bacterium]